MAYTLDEYFAIEQASEERHQYFAGEITVLPGSSLAQGTITVNVIALLHGALRGSSCEMFGCGMRVRTPSGLYTYPIASIACAPLEFLRVGETDTLDNPVVLADVSSEYSRGQKFELCRSIPTLRDYLLIEHSRSEVEHRFLSNGEWASRTITGGAVRLTGVALEIPLALVYERVTF